MTAKLLPLLVLLTLSYVPCPSHGRCLGPLGTTPSIRDIVRGRCEIYQQFVNPDAFCDNRKSTKRNCSEVTETFIKSFSHRKQCNISLGSFDNFVRLTRHDVTSIKRLFWTGVYSIVHKYSRATSRMVTLEDTMTGYLIDGLRFCAQSDDPGMIFGSDCPGFSDTSSCPWNAEYSFWASASKNFACEARGEASLMINASRSPAFIANSFFATWEVPNLSSSLSKLNILMVTIPGEDKKETCGSDSILALKSLLTDKNITSSCTDEPTDVLSVLCLDHLEKEVCRRLLVITSSQSSNQLSSCIIFISILALLM
ncbi:ADP-ribosyl cyclase/cyclic ADP-ribose hydrolase-like [Gigantopelta aegis]|uniref:ADP-ribosyl cyclase/cyclic ADP-ribose hydrolase-like n=1 Tax=Gigantopelta aegis TaxID=1735272 RepID=UPI001B8898CD|nr:ADP-ribosyl cyclase/cyclic ADP-ribose hydrolase-like [Gigantopelta aegis]